MTAYVHIGIAKTGTTSIQDFLTQNYDLLINQGFLYPKSLHGIEEQYSREWSQHRELAFIIKATKARGFLEKESEKLNLFRKEICGFEKVIISSEMLHDSLIDKEHILHCKNILQDLGFKKIKIIIYLREPAELFQSVCSQSIKNCYNQDVCFKLPEQSNILNHRCSHSKTLINWGQVFGKENLIIRLFDKSEFVEQNLLKDFVSCLNINWNEQFIIPNKANESLDVIGSEILLRVNKKLPLVLSGKINFLRGNLLFYVEKYFSNPKLKITPPKDMYQFYIDYFEESNEWVRKEFFPHKERLFPKKDLTDYKENYELKEMKPEYWDQIADFVVDVVETKNKTIQENLSQINNLSQTIETKNKTIQENLSQINNLSQTIETKNKTIQENLSQINNLNQTIETKNKTIQENLSQINNLSQTIETKNKTIQENLSQINNLNQTIETKNKTIQNKDDLLNFQAQYGTAKSRIQNQLSYKLGQTMIVNSKSFLGCLLMPVILLGIVISYKQEQKIYKQKIEKDPSLKLPSLEQYPDYREAIKLKNHLSYKLGKELVKANKIWYKGGYFYFLYFIKKIKI
ncbi:coiled-coil domain-containing protein [Campylobacter coli]